MIMSHPYKIHIFLLLKIWSLARKATILTYCKPCWNRIYERYVITVEDDLWKKVKLFIQSSHYLFSCRALCSAIQTICTSGKCNRCHLNKLSKRIRRSKYAKISWTLVDLYPPCNRFTFSHEYFLLASWKWKWGVFITDQYPMEIPLLHHLQNWGVSQKLKEIGTYIKQAYIFAAFFFSFLEFLIR